MGKVIADVSSETGGDMDDAELELNDIDRIKRKLIDLLGDKYPIKIYCGTRAC